MQSNLKVETEIVCIMKISEESNFGFQETEGIIHVYKNGSSIKY